MERNVIFLGATDNYPVKFTATNSKNELIARGLVGSGCKVTFINSPLGLKGAQTTVQTGERYGSEYYVFAKKGKLSVFSNLRNIYRLLKAKRIKGAKNILITEHSYYPLFMVYVLFGKMLGYKMVVTLTEWHLYFERVSFVKRMDFFLFDYTFGYFTRGIFPISHILEEKVKRFRKPIFKIPILADFEMLKPIEYVSKPGEGGYFMYCGQLGYYSVIEFMVESFVIFHQHNPVHKLKLVVSGPEPLRKQLEALIASHKLQDFIIIEQHLPFQKLMEGYQHALALLIPLRSDPQDKARFSHKIGEYLSSGRPIITSNIGEVAHYFTHGKNALLAPEYTREAYAAMMMEAAGNIEKANSIGAGGRQLGETTFNYITYGPAVSAFLDKI